MDIYLIHMEVHSCWLKVHKAGKHMQSPPVPARQALRSGSVLPWMAGNAGRLAAS